MEKIKLFVCVILPSAWKTQEKSLERFISDIFANCTKLNVHTNVILSYERIGREDWQAFSKLSAQFPGLILNCFDTNSTESANLYLSAFKLALDRGGDLILEVDGSDAHDPAQIPGFLSNAVSQMQQDRFQMLAVMSTRFALGGDDKFPWDRVLLSKAGTLFAKLLLSLGARGKRLTDLTSGFEAFSAPFLRKMLMLHPEKKWVSMWWGPMHLFQTEIRALVCWIAKHDQVQIEELPITFGGNFHRKLSPLSWKYLSKALVGGLFLIAEGIIFQIKLNSIKRRNA